jgi:hypothetical protein
MSEEIEAVTKSKASATRQVSLGYLQRRYPQVRGADRGERGAG